MGALSSPEMRTRKMVLGWLTPKRWSALKEENKVKIYLKVYDKATPDAPKDVNLRGSLSLMDLVKHACS